MNIGNVIKKYRKESGFTQEEMANRLGVTTPAVNKWENGNSNPDIELLAPIARLLHISLDTLLSFHENLTDVEITELIQEMDKMFSVEGYEKTYQWAVNIIKDYPNCNMLIWQVAVMLDSRRIIGQCEHPDKYDEQINFWYEIALNDKDEKIQHHAADSRFGFPLAGRLAGHGAALGAAAPGAVFSPSCRRAVARAPAARSGPGRDAGLRVDRLRQLGLGLSRVRLAGGPAGCAGGAGL